jgi:hypothetical protein
MKLDKSQHSLTQPESGKARIYFIGVDGLIGIDGAWAGVNRGNSYFSVSVDPGERHICVAGQYRDRHGEQLAVIALAHVQAEAGKTYFYGQRGLYQPQVDLIDSDEAKHLLSLYPLSVSSPKK